MDPIFLLTGLASVIGTLGGLLLVCRLERRALNRRRRKPGPASAPLAGDGEPAVLAGE